MRRQSLHLLRAMNRQQPGKRRAFTFVELLVVVVVVLVLAGLVLQSLPAARTKADRIGCINNLKQVGTAFSLWVGDHGGTNEFYPGTLSTNAGGAREFGIRGDVSKIFQLLSNELDTPKLLICPRDVRSAGSNFVMLANSNLSYFVSLDAQQANPNMILAGDRNLETNGRALPAGLFLLTTNATLGWTKDLHNRCGNVALADCSVEQLSNARLAERVPGMGTNINRLVLP